jgi:hypothetical protein
MKKAPVRGPLLGRVNEKCGFAAEAKIPAIDFGRSMSTKKPGAVSRPGIVREFQFPE